jgi:putative colanic acid biosynthesis acetyltransferase WcaF
MNEPSATLKSEHSFANKAARLAWGLVWLFLFRPSPRVFHGWRCFLLRLFGARVGRQVKIYNSVRIWAPWNLHLDDHCAIGDFADCYSVAPLVVGKQAIVSQYSFLCTASHDHRDVSFPLISAPIRIGDRSWVAADVFVGPGVTIGEGAVIGARASVFKDVDPWVVVAGNPARVIRKREMKGSVSSVDGTAS